MAKKRKALDPIWRTGGPFSGYLTPKTDQPSAPVQNVEQPQYDIDWVPPDFPDLSDDHEVEFNFETTGLDWRGNHEPIACAVHCNGHSWYLPWGHRGGGNIEDGKRKFVEWAKSIAGLRGKRLTNTNTKFDAHMGRKVGVDFDALGCTLSDVQHYAGLLDDHRKQFNVEALVREYLGIEPMARVDESRMADYHAGQVAARSEWGVQAVRKLRDVMWPQLTAEGLHDVRQLEDEVIPAVVEMEENGALIDVGLLEQWSVEIDAQVKAIQREVASDIGLGVQEELFEGGRTDRAFINPDSGKDMEALFVKLGLPIERTETGRGRFDADALEHIEHPTIRKLMRQGKLLDLKSKYVVPYLENTNGAGLLRYELHQMRGDENGTVRGRFAAARVNIQQVLKPKKQLKTYGPGFVIRDLFIAPPGELFVSGDAAQIEYRIFADYANNKTVFAAYAEDPWLNFHILTEKMIRALGFNVDYDKAKTLNFLTIYGGGLAKTALQLGLITGGQFKELQREYGDRSKYPYGVPRNHPLLREAVKVKQAYQEALPEVRPLSKLASETATNRGYVRDMLGRRARFIDGIGAHGALNAIIQPSAAEVMKRKMVEVHKRRHELGVTPRMTIHDDWLGSCVNQEAAGKLRAVLNEQSFPKLRVPILWDVKTGLKWSQCAELEDQFKNTKYDTTRDGRSR